MQYKTNSGLVEFNDADSIQIEVFAGNAINVFLLANQAQLEEGNEWYERARALVEGIALKTGIEIRRIAYTIAATSNNIQWDLQEKIMLAFVEHVLVGNEPREFLRGIMPDYAEKGARIILKGDFSACKGPKVQAFAENILGNLDIVTLDRHALRVLLNRFTNDDETSRWVRPGPRRRKAEASYHLAAQELNLPVAYVQAVCWVVARQNKLFPGRRSHGKAQTKAAHISAASTQLDG